MTNKEKLAELVKEHTEILFRIEDGEVLAQNDPDLIRMKELEKEIRNMIER